MTQKIIPFFSISLVIFSMSILLYISDILWIKIIAIVNLIPGLILLNINYYRALKRLIKHDKDFFNKSL